MRFSQVLATALAALALSGQANAAEKVKTLHSTTGFSPLPVTVADPMGHLVSLELELARLRMGSGTKAPAAVIDGDAGILMGSTNPTWLPRARASQWSSSLRLSGKAAETPSLRKSELRSTALRVSAAARTDRHLLEPSPWESSMPAAAQSRSPYLAREAGLDPDRDMTVAADSDARDVRQVSIPSNFAPA